MDGKKIDIEKTIILSKTGAPKEPSVRLSPDFKRYMAGKGEYMPKSDVDFMQGLLSKYGIANGETGQEWRKQFGKDEFFAAVSDFKTYVLGVRERVDEKFNGRQDNDTTLEGLGLNIYGLSEKLRPSSARIGELAYLFLHIPQIKAVYMQIHAEKMSAALPTFIQGLPNLRSQVFVGRRDYFDKVRDLMADAMERNMDENRLAQFEDVGLIMGYQEMGILIPEHIRRRVFSGLGIGTFSKVLEQIVDDAIDKEEDVQTRVRKEFLESGGIANRLMRISLTDFVQIGDRGLDEMDISLRANEFYKGACPAILKVTSSDGSQVQRPIAYEYAATIVEQMPSALLQKAA